jgi:hypothetical protein
VSGIAACLGFPWVWDCRGSGISVDLGFPWIWDFRGSGISVDLGFPWIWDFRGSGISVGRRPTERSVTAVAVGFGRPIHRPVFLNGGAVVFDSPARERLELSPITIAKSRSAGIGYNLVMEFRQDRQRGADATPQSLRLLR